MTSRQKIRITLGMSGVSAVVVILGICMKRPGMAAVGLLLYTAGIVTALFSWRVLTAARDLTRRSRKRSASAAAGSWIMSSGKGFIDDLGGAP